ncbi:hypothetical protein R3W88_022234 [Solanum pinnatisectum]|uniref:S-protein homolog n=1 Tax=Solanum pinnatisectum TaxID=50273 RepID=A0AAV9LU43_9SOLN|nr:hypothetical protein R3W88_022234 [Solanum pinnatisectum]
MAYYPCTKFQLPLLIFFVNLVIMTNASVFNPAINEIFINNISRSTPPLNVHCLSRDDDLGVHTLEPGDKYDFSFHENFLSTTHFYCKLKWGRNSSIFDVYYKKQSLCYYKFFKVTDLYCTWSVQDYAIYLALVKNPSPSDFKFAYTW